MRAFRFLNLGILAALLASSAVLYAQDEKPQEDKPAKQEEPKKDNAKPESKDMAKPESKQDDMKAPSRMKPSLRDRTRDKTRTSLGRR